MGFIPIGKDGKQAYAYDSRTPKTKLLMWFWKKIGIPLIGETIKGKEFQLEKITGEKKKYINCTFKRCRFDHLKLVFITNSYIEYDTPNPRFSNLSMCEIKGVRMKKVKPVTNDLNSEDENGSEDKR